MGGSQRWILASSLLLLAGCSTTNSFDLTNNPRLYSAIAYRSASAAKRSAHVAPVEDLRVPAPEVEHNAPWVVEDQVWAKPVPVMVHQLLCDELTAANLFTGLVDETAADVYILPRLRRLEASTQETINGRLIRGKCQLELAVHGPRAADGQRPLWFEQLYENRELKQEGLGSEANMYVFYGQALKITLSRLLIDLDSRGVGREGEPATPTEASGNRQ
jgi:hypothetical protein